AGGAGAGAEGLPDAGGNEPRGGIVGIMNRMRSKGLIFGGILLAALLGAGPAATQSGGSSGAGSGASSLEIRATTAFNGGQYAMALPLLQKLQTQLAGEPDKRGLIEEEI